MQHESEPTRESPYDSIRRENALEAEVNAIALKQPVNPSLEEVHANLQERARAIVERRPDLEDFLNDRPPVDSHITAA
jgi:hypothetical protein